MASKSLHMPKLYRWDKQLAALLMLSFFLPPRAQVLVLIPLCLFFAIRDIAIKREVNRPKLLYAILMGSLYLLYAAWFLFTPEPYKSDVRFFLESKASLLLLPLVMACLHAETINTITGRLHWFVVGCLLSCSCGNLIYIYRNLFANPQFLNHVSYRLGFESITGIHPTYMGMYLCFCMAILLFHTSALHRLKAWHSGLLLFLIFAFLFALFPKTPLIATLLILGYYGLLYFRDRKKWRVPAIAFGAALLIAFTIPFSRQRAVELKGFFPAGTQSPVENSIHMREIIWHMDMRLLQQHWLAGVGPGRIRTELEHLYFALSTMAGLPIQYYDTHNEYLNIWISFGLSGIGVLLLILSIQFARAIKDRNRLYLCLLLTVCICFMTENVLSNQRGIVFYAFFTALLFAVGNKLEIRGTGDN